MVYKQAHVYTNSGTRNIIDQKDTQVHTMMLKAHKHLATADGCFGARAQYRKMAESEQHGSVLLPPCIFPTSPLSLGCSPCCRLSR